MENCTTIGFQKVENAIWGGGGGDEEVTRY